MEDLIGSISVTNGYKWLQMVTNGYKWLQMVTNGYKPITSLVTSQSQDRMTGGKIVTNERTDSLAY